MKHNKEVKESFKHWVRMYRWIKGYKNFTIALNKINWYEAMSIEMHENPISVHCALCQKYEKEKCKGCPLISCGEGSLWINVMLSKTKQEWLRNAKKMIAKLWQLRFYNETKNNQ